MNQLAFIKQNDVFTNTWVVAQNIGYAHKDITDHITKHKTRFKKMGNCYAVNVKITTGAGRPVTAYQLNEQQAIFLMTLLDNSDRVLDFKQALAMEFVAMRRLLLEQQSADWQQMRLTAKGNRLHTTEAIKELVEYAKAQGSEHAEMLYTVYSKLIKQMAECTSRDFASTETLSTIICLERIITGVIWQEMSRNTHYKAIYQRAKDELTNLVNLWAIPKLTA